MSSIVTLVIVGFFFQWIVGSPIQHYLDEERIVDPWVSLLIRIAIGVIGPIVVFVSLEIFGPPKPSDPVFEWRLEHWWTR